MKGQAQFSNPQLVTLLVSVIGLLAAVYFGSSIAQGNVKTIYAVLVFAIGAAIVLGLGKRYWLLAVIGFTLNLPLLPLGVRSFELPEVTAFGVFVIFFLMVALHRNHVHLGKLENFGVYFFFGLVALVYALHPVGLLAGGSSVVGGRFYFKILLAFLVFLTITNQTIENIDAKWIIRFLLIGSLLSLVWGLTNYFILGNREVGDEDGYYSWHQILAGPPFIFAVWMFSRYKPSQVFSIRNISLPLLYMLAVAVAFSSGKRAMVGSIFIVPVISSFIHRQYRYSILAISLLGVFFTIVVAGQGNLFDFPLSAQRALMYLPANWDPEISSLKSGGSLDEFRKQMREKAWDKAMEAPWLGEGLRIDLADTADFGANILQQDPVTLLSLGKSWHSFWLGLAADFGFFAWPLYALIYFSALHTALWVIKRSALGEYRRTLAQMMLILMTLSILKSYTSGHSAETPFGEWWTFAVLIAMKYTIIAEKKQDGTIASPLIPLESSASSGKGTAAPIFTRPGR